MPRASYGDKMTVSIIQGEQDTGKHHVLDFTSKVIDFAVIDSPESGFDNPVALIVLLEEEIVVIDLKDKDWLQFKLPYLSSVHSSGITASQYYSGVPDEVFDSILSVGKKQDEGKYSRNSWPITGGSIPCSGEGEASQSKQERTKDLLITGHEDGSIVFWNASHVNLYHILSIQTRKFFLATDSDIIPIDGEEVDQQVEDEWPPFRRVGTFDPFSDDVRLAVRKIAFCPMTGVFFAAGTAGQVISFKLSQEAKEVVIEPFNCNVVEETTGFVWKGHDQLHMKTGGIKVDAGFHPQYVVQIHPPAAVTALTVNSEWSLISAGTAHGFTVFDYIQQKVVYLKSTLNASDLAATSGGDGALITRRKSFKKSLRESFRRLRRGRSTRSKSKAGSPTPAAGDEAAGGSGSASATTSPVKKVVSPVRSIASDDDARPVERQIEARTDDGLGSMIRTLYFTTACIISGSTPVPSLWVGTSSGSILIHTITILSDDKRSGVVVPSEPEAPLAVAEAAIDAPAPCPVVPPAPETVSVTLAKEIQLKHRAPVVFIQVIDSTGYPLPGPFEVEKGKAKAASTVGSQKVLIVSEEQFKLFTLPNLKPDRKSKLTAHEGSRARKIAVGHFVSKSDEKVIEHAIICASNLGDVSVYSFSDLKRLKHDSVVKSEDVHGISSIILSSSGEGLYLHSPSEFMRFTVSARKVLLPNGVIAIPDSVRHKKPEPPMVVEKGPLETVVEEQEEEEENVEAIPEPLVEVPLESLVEVPLETLVEEEVEVVIPEVQREQEREQEQGQEREQGQGRLDVSPEPVIEEPQPQPQEPVVNGCSPVNGVAEQEPLVNGASEVNEILVEEALIEEPEVTPPALIEVPEETLVEVPTIEVPRDGVVEAEPVQRKPAVIPEEDFLFFINGVAD